VTRFPRSGARCAALASLCVGFPCAALPVVAQQMSPSRPAAPQSTTPQFVWPNAAPRAPRTTPAPLPPDTLLAGITRRGQALASYLDAVWRGADAVLALGPGAGAAATYIARPTDGGGWAVVFGQLAPRGDAFLASYEARPARGGRQGARDVAYAAERLTPARADTGYYLRAALAVQTALADFGTTDRPYNAAALPAPGGRWWVYVMPAPTADGKWPLGGDSRYLVAPSGRTIVEHRRLHISILAFGTERHPAYAKLEPQFHTSILDDVPEDTDVLHVLTRTPAVPQYVITDAFCYRIETSGAITLLGRREEVLGK
jgi:hypothetical protein